ncbi:DedA family protein [Oceanobacillus profundus]|uniref:DedA family protein n=1 Tax=Oceanobacillus profundus TaxID=372463 RepID=A0A417YIA2_9BACI|nr:DedA family protein [Oceanobacillus profundus]MCM3400124.1 DedA family protein [Oceanobacillus profundus]MDO6449869.1 DedA family protein [Oceanobacillus profundus]RHW32684.1 DedA family protein [Oceanobacillus profundus]
MENWITSIMEQFGYIGIFLLIMVENLFPPIPSEVILTFGGFMTTHSNLTILGVVIAATIGSVVGAIVLYGVGFVINVDRIEKIVDRWGHILRLTREDIHKANAWFEKYGVWTVFFCRFIPLIRSLISLPAGMARMNFWVFLALTTVGTFIWNVVLVNIGAAVGDSWETIVGYMDIYSNIVYAVLAVLFIVLVWLFIKKRFKK